jgi:hypothetical protein
MIIDPECLVTVAMLADEWDCMDIVKIWALPKLYAFPPSTATIDNGMKLVAAYITRAPAQFERLSASAMQELQPDFLLEWHAQDLLGLLPASVHSKVQSLWSHISQLILPQPAF